MKINGKAMRTIWRAKDGVSVEIFDQTKLPHRLEFLTLSTMTEAAHAIKSMQVRGAPLIGATAAYGLAMGLRDDASDAALKRAIDFLNAQRPTAVNLRWALDEVRKVVAPLPPKDRARAAYAKADAICN
jgi:methylthioribose-1-phosphate isomerase